LDETSYSHSEKVDGESIQRVGRRSFRVPEEHVCNAVCDEHPESRFELTEVRDDALRTAAGSHDRHQKVRLPFHNDVLNIGK